MEDWTIDKIVTFLNLFRLIVCFSIIKMVFMTE